MFDFESIALAVKMSVCGLCGCSFLSSVLYYAAVRNAAKNPAPKPPNSGYKS